MGYEVYITRKETWFDDEGEEGDQYGADGEPLESPAQAAPLQDLPAANAPATPWWKFRA